MIACSTCFLVHTLYTIRHQCNQSKTLLKRRGGEEVNLARITLKLIVVLGIIEVGELCLKYIPDIFRHRNQKIQAKFLSLANAYLHITLASSVCESLSPAKVCTNKTMYWGDLKTRIHSLKIVEGVNYSEECVHIFWSCIDFPIFHNFPGFFSYFPIFDFLSILSIFLFIFSRTDSNRFNSIQVVGFLQFRNSEAGWLFTSLFQLLYTIARGFRGVFVALLYIVTDRVFGIYKGIRESRRLKECSTKLMSVSLVTNSGGRDRSYSTKSSENFNTTLTISPSPTPM